MKTSELTGAALDWAVANCDDSDEDTCLHIVLREGFTPSTDWAQGGPIIEREGISIWVFDDVTWKAENPFASGVDQVFEAETPLIAAMRCYVASKLGDEVEIPAELVGEQA